MCREDVYTSYCSGAVGRFFWAGGDWGTLPGPVSGTVGEVGCLGIQPQTRGVSNCSETTEFCQRGWNSSHSGLWPAAFVRQAATGDRILLFRSNKKHHRFFQWFPKHPTSPTVPETGPGSAPQSPPAQKNRPQPRNSNSYRLGYT